MKLYVILMSGERPIVIRAKETKSTPHGITFFSETGESIAFFEHAKLAGMWLESAEVKPERSI